jgi:hypothetical protein
MPALSNVALTDTFDTWRIRTNQLIVKTNDDELASIAAFNKANSANVLAYNTGIGTNTYLLTTITGANIAVGDGANAYSNLITTGANNHLKSIIMGANTDVGTGANLFSIATISGANTYLLNTIAGANTTVGAGANAFASATIAGANNISIAAFNKANNALANSSGISFNGNLNFPNGNVGIGTSSPTTKFNVFGSASGGITTLTDNTSIVISFTSNNNFVITLGGSNTFINPTNHQVGQSGVIEINQDNTGSRAPSWGSYWKFPSNTAPTLTATSNSKDIIVYYVSEPTKILCQSILNIG